MTDNLQPNPPAARGKFWFLAMTGLAAAALAMVGVALYLLLSEYRFYQAPPSVWPAAGAVAMPVEPAPGHSNTNAAMSAENAKKLP